MAGGRLPPSVMAIFVAFTAKKTFRYCFPSVLSKFLALFSLSITLKPLQLR